MSATSVDPASELNVNDARLIAECCLTLVLPVALPSEALWWSRAGGSLGALVVDIVPEPHGCSWACTPTDTRRGTRIATRRDRYEAKVDRSAGHHLLTGSKNADGTGKMKVDSKAVTAQRIAWELVHGQTATRN
jgi:hypothetical protein